MGGGRNAAWRIENVGTSLSSASAVFERAVLGALRDGEFGWVGQVQLALFRNLDLDGTHLTELAARARMTKQSMQELVDKAEALGVVERRPSPRDRRVKIVAFTAAGLRMLEQFRRGVAEAERRMAEALGEDFVAELKLRLCAYVAAMEPGPAGDRTRARPGAARPETVSPSVAPATAARPQPTRTAPTPRAPAPPRA